MSRDGLKNALRPVVDALRPEPEVQMIRRLTTAVRDDGKVPATALKAAEQMSVLTFYVPGTLAVATNAAEEIVVPASGTIVRIDRRVKTVPIGSSLLLTLTRNGTGIKNMTIAASAQSSTSGEALLVSAGDILRINVTQVGSTSAGASLTVGVAWVPAIT